jgi:prevent-host-death family protein
MRKVTATELKNHTSECISQVQTEPVEINKNGRVCAVMIAAAEYERLSQFENAYWLARAEEAEKGGYIGVEATAELFKDRLKKKK